MRVLGVDPGTFRMGVGIVVSSGADLSLAYSGVVTPRRQDPISRRLHYLFVQLSDIVAEWQPSEVAIEEPFAAHNVRSAMAIGHAQAVAMVVAAHHGLTVTNYAPRQVKQAVTDYGNRYRRWSGCCWVWMRRRSPRTPRTPWPWQYATSTPATLNAW